MSKSLLQRNKAGTPAPQYLQTGTTGDDVFFVNDSNEVVNDSTSTDHDVAYASVNWTMTAGSRIEVLSAANVAATTPLQLIGNEFGQEIYGNAGDNFIDGGGGADYMQGFAGNDTYIINHGSDFVAEGAGEGTRDVIYSRTSYTMAAGIQVEVLSVVSQSGGTAIDLTGNAFYQELYGNTDANFLDGGAGADSMQGFTGNDSYIVDHSGDAVIEGAGEGTRDVIYARTHYTMAAGLEVEVLSVISQSGGTAIDLTGNAFYQEMYGNTDANFLDGGAGADSMQGFTGNDSYIVDHSGDAVIEGAGEGTRDVIYARTSYTMAAGLDVEVLSVISQSGGTAIDLTGNELFQELYGNTDANFLDGGAGADFLQGFTGNDVYIVDVQADTIVEGAAEGARDVVSARASYALAAGVGIEVMTTISGGATTAIDLTGNEIANELYGNAGANVLNGGGGVDYLEGGGGNDTFAFTTALGGGNVDTVADFNVVADTISLGGAAGQPFATLATGSLRAGTLVIGAAALDADDYLIYNSGTGALMYDADGNGAGAAVQIAALSTGLGLTVADFLVTGLANNAPSVTSPGTASIAENSAASTVVYQTAATDADGDRITYSLSGTDAGLLTVDANGAVRLITPADFETKASYVFNVLVSDSGVTTTRAVTLSITDISEGGGSTPIINETTGPNNSRLNAQSIDPGTFVIATNPNLPNDDYPSATIVGSLSDNNDVDYYSITLQAGEQLILDIDFTTNSLDSFLELYGPNSGTLIGDNDDLITLDPGSNPPFGHNTDSQIIFRASTSGTYFFAVSSFENGSSGNYQLHVSINNAPVTPEQIMAEDVDAMISGAAWNHTNLTYGFPASAAVYPQDFEEVSSSGPGDPVPTFQAFTAGQQAATRALLQLVANVSSLTFTELTGGGDFNTAGSAASADLRYAESNEAEVAYAYYPTNGGPDSVGGSSWYNHDDFNSPIRGNYDWMGILHETGHALGLKHGHEFPAISFDHDSLEYSVMTYRSYPGDNVAGGYGNEQYGFPQTLMMLDIAALQKIYDGANYAFNSGNSTYTWNENTGEMSINGTGQGGPGNGVGGTANRVLMTIWDGGGTDTYNLSNYNDNTTIDLRPGEWTTTDPGQLANLGANHFARGNVANALLFEGSAQSAIENAIGGVGANTMIANLVANQLTGNGGADTFKWMKTGDAGTGVLADTVLDFVRGTDKIDFTALDAQPGTAGQQDFAFIGTGAFTNVAGQVRYDVTGGNAHIFADADGNGSADMQIILNGITTLAASDFNF